MQAIHIDISRKAVLPTISAKQGDVGRKFKAIFTDSGLPYDLSGANFSVFYSGASGKGNYTHIGENSAFTADKSTVTVELITQMLTNPGKGTLCLVMSRTSGETIGTWNVDYSTEAVPGASSEAAQDYYTAFSKAVDDLKAIGAQQTPLFANDISECVDTTKVYVLPDGFIYAYIETTTTEPAYTNLAEPLPGNTTDTAKWVNGYRFNSGGSPVAAAGTTISNSIPCAVGDVIRIKGAALRENSDRIVAYSTNSSGVIGTNADYFNRGITIGGYKVRYDGLSDGVYTFTLEEGLTAKIHALRFSMATPADASAVIVTVNEEIKTGTVTGYGWVNTGHAFVPADYEDRIISLEDDVRELQSGSASGGEPSGIPTYWEAEVASKTEAVKALQEAGGKDCVSFAWAADVHAPDNDDGITTHLGKVMAKMLDNCEIPFAVLSGDINTRASHSAEATLIQSHGKMREHLAPLWGTERLLIALGNHDGAWGDSSAYYGHQYPPEKLWQIFFRGQALDFRRVFSEDGLYFYVDNVPQKVRFIVLNCQFGGEYAEDENGLAVHDHFHTACYGQAQLDWLTKVALDLPEGYGAVITAHDKESVDRNVLAGILDAYNRRTSYSGSYTAGVDGWSNCAVSVDFTNAKGEVLAFFAGHVHGDSISTASLPCPYLTILAAGAAPNKIYEATAPTRTPGTATETSFDIVTINRGTRTIYCTRVGAGDDRVVNY